MNQTPPTAAAANSQPVAGTNRLAPSATAVLQADGVSKRYGNNWVLRDASLTLQPGQVLALLGENGAGKSTFMKILSGAVAADAGSVRVGGQPLSGQRPDQARQAGLAIVYQELSVCLDLSITDNILLGRERSRWGRLDHRQQEQLVRDGLTRLGHADLDPQTPLSALSIGQRQVVEIARALVDDVKVLILDEPTSSLAAADVARLFETIERLSAQGIAVIYISHFLEEVLQICDSYLVLRDGEVAGQGQLAGIQEPEIVQLMVGRSVDELFPQVPHRPGAVWLQLQEVAGERLPRSVSLEVRRGEIFGLAGLVGAGRTETLRLIAGLDRCVSGQILAAGQPLTGNVRQRIDCGIAMVSEDRKQEGLAQNLSIIDNLLLSHSRPYHWAGWLRQNKRRRATEDWIDRMQIKTPSPEQAVAGLSGGNQQKVAIARAWHQQGDCLLLDEPTRGVDVGTKAEIYRLICQAAAQDRAVVFVSGYFRELLEVCDTIAVMARGVIVQTRPADQWTEHELLLAAMGQAISPANDAGSQASDASGPSATSGRSAGHSATAGPGD